METGLNVYAMFTFMLDIRVDLNVHPSEQLV